MPALSFRLVTFLQAEAPKPTHDTAAGAADDKAASEVKEKNKAADAATKMAKKATGDQEKKMKASAAEAQEKVATQKATAAKEAKEKSDEAKQKAAAVLAASKENSVENMHGIEVKYKEKVDKVDTQLDQQKAGIRAQKKADVGAIKAAARKDGGHVADIGTR